MGIYKKFKSIKLTIIEGRKLKPFAVAKVLQDHEDRLKALEGDSEEVVPVTRKITFTINDGTDAIEGATVTIDGTSKTTGSAGGCSFDGIADGSVSVTVSATGFTTKTETITVSENDTSFTISLVSA